jgi:hypothetical protein
MNRTENQLWESQKRNNNLFGFTSVEVISFAPKCGKVHKIGSCKSLKSCLNWGQVANIKQTPRKKNKTRNDWKNDQEKSN